MDENCGSDMGMTMSFATGANRDIIRDILDNPVKAHCARAQRISLSRRPATAVESSVRLDLREPC